MLTRSRKDGRVLATIETPPIRRIASSECEENAPEDAF
jgi:hypothetical protein